MTPWIQRGRVLILGLRLALFLVLTIAAVIVTLGRRGIEALRVRYRSWRAHA